VVAVPDVVGESASYASVSVLSALGFVISFTGARCCLGVVVVAQNPKAGTLVPRRTTMTLMLAASTTSSSQPRFAPCSASQMTALAPAWVSPLEQQTDDLLRFTNTGATCELSGYPAVVAASQGKPDVQGKPGVPVFPPWNGNSIVLPHGSTARLIVAAVHSCADTATYPYTTLTVAMPGRGSVVVTLPTDNVSPNPDQNGHNLTLRISPSCPPYVGYFSH